MLKVSDVINPVHPNRATKLFGGKSSGILNWNDIKYPHLYDMREEMRANFYVSAEIQLQELETYPNQYEFYMNELLHSTYKQLDLQNSIANLSTDPAVTSIFSTMYDQLHEHMESVQRALQHFNLHLDTNVTGVKRYNIDTVDDLLDEIVRLIELKLVGIEPPQELDKGSQQILQHIVTDKINHILFLCEIHNLTSREYGLSSSEFVHNTKKYILGIKDKEIISSDVDGVDMDNWDDL